MTISIIIPTYNEAEGIGKLIEHLRHHADSRLKEIIIADGGSTDNTIEIASRSGAQAVVSPAKGRAAQMNYGASLAGGEVLYFVHADSFPAISYIDDIERALQKGYSIGRYRSRFDSKSLLLKVNAWFTRFDLFYCMGGDQTLFIEKSLFEKNNGFNEHMKIMEEYEFCERVRKNGKYIILDGEALISARKYETNSWWRVQRANSRIVKMYKNGASQDEMIETYKRMLSYRKNAF